MTPTKIWLLMAVFCVVVEILPPPTHFFFLCVALGALAASMTAFFSALPWLPWAVFFVTSLALTPMLVPLAKFLFTPRPHASNVDALIGQKALVMEPIDPKSAGVVKIGGEIWRALAEDRIEKDQWVQVVRIQGTSVVVKGA